MRVILLAALLYAPLAGAVDVSPCLQCHEGAKASNEVPVLAGQQSEYLIAQLQRFRDHLRESFPMDALAAGLNDAVIADIADTLSKRQWQSAEVASSEAALAQGRSVAERFACSDCHGERFLGAGAIPRLAGQYPGYLARQLRAFADGRRHHPPTGTGARVYQLQPDEIEVLTAWLNALR